MKISAHSKEGSKVLYVLKESYILTVKSVETNSCYFCNSSISTMLNESTEIKAKQEYFEVAN